MFKKSVLLGTLPKSSLTPALVTVADTWKAWAWVSSAGARLSKASSPRQRASQKLRGRKQSLIIELADIFLLL